MGDRMKRWAFLLIGLASFGVGIALMVHAKLGLGPWDVLHQGISRLLHIPIGMASVFTGTLVMFAWLPLRERVGIGTLLNIVLIGTVTDLTLAVLPEITNLAVRTVLMVGGVLIVGVGSGLYLSSNMGAGPRDGLMLGISKRTGWSVRLVRTLIELTVLVSGVLLGGTVGLGTVVFALGIGPTVQFSLRLFERLNVRPTPANAVAIHRA